MCGCVDVCVGLWMCVWVCGCVCVHVCWVRYILHFFVLHQDEEETEGEAGTSRLVTFRRSASGWRPFGGRLTGINGTKFTASLVRISPGELGCPEAPRR